jgi:hypothetical protein
MYALILKLQLLGGNLICNTILGGFYKIHARNTPFMVSKISG